MFPSRLSRLSAAKLIVLPVAFSGVLVGCSSVATIQPDAAPLVDHFNSSEAAADSAAENSTVPSKWWTEFDDDLLDQLVEQALQDNFQMKAELARLRQSQANWDKAGSGQYPDLTLTANRSREWRETQGVGQTTGDSWSLGLTTSYELDFWGRVSAQAEQAEYLALASQQGAQIRANTVASQIALTWYGWNKERQTVVLLDHQKARIQEALSAVKVRYLRGQSQVSDVWQQEQLLESIEADLINAKASQAGYRQQLALWLGQSQFDPQSLLSNHDLNESYLLPDIKNNQQNIAGDVLLNRPDIEQAFFSLQAANAGLAVAAANRYPRFTLTANYTGSDADIENVLDNWLANLVAGVALPLIDGDNRRAEVRRNEAIVDEKLADYYQTVLVAVQETEQALIDEKKQFELTSSIDRRLELAQRNERYQLQRYQRGVGDFLSLLTSQQDVLNLERSQLSAQFLVLQNRIQLFKTINHQTLIDTQGTAL